MAEESGYTETYVEMATPEETGEQDESAGYTEDDLIGTVFDDGEQWAEEGREVEHGPEPVWETREATFSDEQKEKAELRIGQLKEQGIDEGFAAYIANMEQELKQSRNTEPLHEEEALQRTADLLGMPADELVYSAQQEVISGRAGELQAAGVDRETALEIAENEYLEGMQWRENVQRQAQDTALSAFSGDLERLYEAYPEMGNGNPIPGEVIADFKRGLTPLEAYQKYQLRQGAMAKERAAFASQKSTGSAQSQGAAQDGDMASVIMNAFRKG